MTSVIALYVTVIAVLSECSILSISFLWRSKIELKKNSYLFIADKIAGVSRLQNHPIINIAFLFIFEIVVVRLKYGITA